LTEYDWFAGMLIWLPMSYMLIIGICFYYRLYSEIRELIVSWPSFFSAILPYYLLLCIVSFRSIKIYLVIARCLTKIMRTCRFLKILDTIFPFCVIWRRQDDINRLFLPTTKTWKKTPRKTNSLLKSCRKYWSFILSLTVCHHFYRRYYSWCRAYCCRISYWVHLFRQNNSCRNNNDYCDQHSNNSRQYNPHQFSFFNRYTSRISDIFLSFTKI
jgi:hypothetical protein